MTSDDRVGIEDLLAHADWVRGLARHLAGGEGDDVAQDAWVIAERSPPDPTRPARPWFAQVLRNLVRGRRRDEARRARREEDYVQTLSDRAPAVDQVYERLELHRFLAAQVMALEEPLRTFVILRYFEGLDSARIGELTGTPSGTVRWRLKTAIDRLRSALDARHEGERRAWVVILIPGAVARSAGRALTGAMLMANAKTNTVLIVSLVVLALLVLSGGGALLWLRGTVSSATDRSITASDNFASVTDGGRSSTLALKHVPGPFLASVPTDFGECRAAVARTHEEVAEREREARRLVPRAAFESGTPNSRLREEVSPQVDRLLAGADESKVPIHHLECRAWACKLTVIIAYEDTGAVQPWLRALGSWLPRLKGLQSLAMAPPSPLGIAVQWAGTSTKADLLAHQKVEESHFFFGSPSGGASETEPIAETPAVASATLEECHGDLASVRERLRRLHAELAGLRPSATIFAAGSNAPEPTARMKAVVERVFGATAAVGVECRSGVCRVPFVPPDPAALERLRADPGVHDLIRKEQQADGALYLTMGESGQSAISRLLTLTRAPSFFAGCAQPERAGNLLLRVLVPATGAANDDGIPGRASVRILGGSLSGTPAGDCLAERVSAVTGEDLPSPVGGGLRFESWTWEPGGTPVLTPSP